MDQVLIAIHSAGQSWFGFLWPLVWNLVKILCVVLPMMGCIAYLTLWERKMIGWMHVRIGPNRVGPAGLLQPIADVLKLSKSAFVVYPSACQVPMLTPSETLETSNGVVSETKFVHVLPSVE